MAKLTLLWSPDPHALLARASAAFTVADRVVEPLPVLALRQGGIRDAVRETAALAGCNEGRGTPIVVFDELPTLFAGDMAPLNALDRRAITRRILASDNYPVLGAAARSRGFAQALDSLLGDLVAERIAEESLPDLLARDGRDRWELARDEEVARLYSAYHVHILKLAPSGNIARTDGRDGLSIAAEMIRLHPERVRERLRRACGDAPTRRSIDVYGLTDLRGGWGAFLDALHHAEFLDEARVYAQRSPEADAHTELWNSLVAKADAVEQVPAVTPLSPLTTLRDSLFSIACARQPVDEQIGALAAPDMQRELEGVARRVKQLIVKHGAEPRRIAVIARQARPYATRAAEIFSRFGIPATARLRHTLSDVPVARALLRLLAGTDGWTITALSEIAASPYFNVDVDLGVLGHVAKMAQPRSLPAWTDAIEHAHAAAAAADLTGDDDDTAGLHASRVNATARGFARFADAVGPLAATRPISRWIDTTLALLGSPPTQDARVAEWEDGILGLAANACAPPSVQAHDTASDLLIDAVRLDTAALTTLVTLLTEWRDSMAHLGADDPWLTSSVAATVWAAELERLLQDEEVALTTTRQDGVQLVEALAASGRPFDHIFIVGMSAGAFPADPGARRLFPDWECTELHARGLPLDPASAWFEREAGLFQSLVASARRTLTISHSYADDDGRPRLPSAYYDEVMSHFAASTDANAMGTVSGQMEQRVAGSLLLPPSCDEVWSADDLLLYAAGSWSHGEVEAKAIARAALAHLSANADAKPRIDHLLHVAQVEHERDLARTTPVADRRDAAHAWNGAIDDGDLLKRVAVQFGDRVWSATQLERYGRCAFSFFGSHVLGARPVDTDGDVEEDITGLERGVVLHDILARAYAGLLAAFADDALDPVHFNDARLLIADAVDAALANQPGAWAEIIGLREARAIELRRTVERYVRWDMGQSEAGKPARRKPEFFELGFGVHGSAYPEVTFATDSGTLRLRGRIDRIDSVIDPRATGWRYVIDLKSGASAFTDSTQLQPAGALLQLALYMAAARQMLGDEVLGGAYHVVHTLGRKAGLARGSLVKKGLQLAANKTQIEAEATLANAPSLALSLVHGIVAGRFAARPPGTVKCLHYCDLRDVCREERMGTW